MARRNLFGKSEVENDAIVRQLEEFLENLKRSEARP